MSTGMKSGIIIITIVLMAALPLLLVNGDFGGSDNAAESMIKTINPAYKPWFSPLMKPPAETESMLFALQAAIGAGIIGYTIGLLRGRSSASKKRND